MESVKLEDISSDIYLFSSLISAINNKLFASFAIDPDISVSFDFRDCLLHYKKMYEILQKDIGNNIDNIFLHRYAIYQHIESGIKKSITYFVRQIFKKIDFIKKQEKYQDLDISKKNQIRKIFHNIKNILLDIRHKEIFIEVSILKEIEPTTFQSPYAYYLIKLQDQTDDLKNILEENGLLDFLYVKF